MGRIVSIGDAAEALGVSIDTLRRWDEAGALAAERTVGGQRRYDLDNLHLTEAKSSLPLLQGQLAEALEHLEAMLGLVARFNGNHQPVTAWCIRCESSVLHGPESCHCCCHTARAFVAALRAEMG